MMALIKRIAIDPPHNMHPSVAVTKSVPTFHGKRKLNVNITPYKN